MVLRVLLVVLCCAPAHLLQAQSDTLVDHYLRTITQQELRGHLQVLASDAYEGRETGFKGQKMAAEYLRTAFTTMGIGPVPGWEQLGLLAPGYEQPFLLDLTRPGSLHLEVDGAAQVFLRDYLYFGEKTERTVTAAEIVFMGLGKRDLQRDDYQGVDVKGKVVLVLEEDDGHVAMNAVPDNAFFTGFSRRVTAAAAAGAAVVLYATPNTQALIQEFEHYLNSPRMELKGDKKEQPALTGTQALIIDHELAKAILLKGDLRWKKVEKAAKAPGRSIPCPVVLARRPRVDVLQAENVLGYVEGTDLKDELVIVTAHYDHIGTSGGEVYNGADDDGSGTVALLEMAQAFAQAKAEGHGPRRSVLFMPVSGEEKGLLGSEYYSDHPVFPLEATVADLNIDMIGRTDSAHTNSAPYVYIIGSDRLSTELHDINEKANKEHVSLSLDYTFNAPDDPNRFYFRSDHYNFARYGVPVIFYFSGIHEDYHQPGDEVEKIRFDLLEQRARLVFATAWELANRTQRIVVDKPLVKPE